jgi:hypothetical protein
MARSLDLGQRVAPRGRPRHGPVAARGACSRGARGALARLVVPPGVLVYPWTCPSTPGRARLPPHVFYAR